MTIYRDENHAAIRAAAIDAISTTKPAGWQQAYRSGFAEELTKQGGEDVEHFSPGDRLLQDCIFTRQLIRRRATEQEWQVFAALYSADEKERAEAVRRLATSVTSPAPVPVRLAIIWAWCSEAMRRGFVAQLQARLEVPETTWRRWRKGIFVQLEALRKSGLERIAPDLQEAELMP